MRWEKRIMDEIAVLIPCYNESQTIEKVVKDFKTVLPEAVIYVYDNNSSDNTAEIAANAGAVVRHEYQQGKGNVIRRMFRDIDAKCYVMTDGDDTYPADNAREMCDAVLTRNVDMVVGDRLSSTYFQENKRPFHNFGNSIVRWSNAVDKNMFLENVVIEYRDRPEGSESKLNTYSDGFKVIFTIIKLLRTYKPMFFFGMIALIFVALGVGFMIPVIVEFAQTGLVPKVPTLIVCCISILIGILSFFSGMILHTITWKNRQDFEMKLVEIADKYKKA